MTIGGETVTLGEGDFIFVGRNVHRSGKNIAAGESELLYLDYFPPDSRSSIGLE